MPQPEQGFLFISPHIRVDASVARYCCSEILKIRWDSRSWLPSSARAILAFAQPCPGVADGNEGRRIRFGTSAQYSQKSQGSRVRVGGQVYHRKPQILVKI